MKEKYRKWIERSGDWQRALDDALDYANSTDVLVHHERVAFAFPSTEPNERSFEFPSIDQQWLRAWASERGWNVDFANEKATEKTKKRPPVRFTKN